MRKRIISILIAFLFLFSNTTFVYARSSGGHSSASHSSSHSVSSSSKSSTSRSVTGSSSKTSGYSGSSSSKSSTSGSSSTGSTSSGSSSNSSKSSGYSGSSSSKSTTSDNSSTGSTSSGSTSSSSKSSGYSGSSSSKSTTSGSSSTGSTSSGSASSSSKTTSKTESLKNSYMSDAYKKQASSSNYSSYKSKLNDEQKQTYDSSMNKNYYTGNKMNFEDASRTRSTRMNSYNSRPIRININTYHFGGSMYYGTAFAGPWDLWFLTRASDMFWYHHWTDIYPYRDYFEAAQFAEMENRIRALEAQNIARDSNYMDSDADPDLAFSSDYQEKNVDKLYYTDKYSKPVHNPATYFIPILLISIGLILVIYALSRRKPQKPGRNSNKIY